MRGDAAHGVDPVGVPRDQPHAISSPPAQHGEEVDRADEVVGAWSRGT